MQIVLRTERLVYPKSAICDTATGVCSLNSEVMSFSVALRDVFTTLERVCSALLVTIIFLPVQGIFSVSPRILQRFKTLEIVDLLIFMLCAT
jgi:hypothetical protein